MNTEVYPLTSDRLALRCAEESSRRDPQSRDNRFCFELVRRAFGLEDNYALGLVLSIYRDVWSRFWIRDAASFETQAITADDFKSIAFQKVYHQIKGNRFSSFSSLNAVLAYLRKTLVRTVAAYYRSLEARQQFVPSTLENGTDSLENIPSMDNPGEEAEKNLTWQAVEQRVYVLLPNEPDRILFGCWARQSLSRAEIVSQFGAHWPDENAVRVALQRIRRRLVKDAVLRDLLRGLT